MSESDPSLREKLEAELLKKSAAAAVDRAAEKVEKAANQGLDALERMLFGDKSAEEVVKAEETADPLERLRLKYGAKETTPKAEKAPEEDPVEKAKAQLAALKKARGL